MQTGGSNSINILKENLPNIALKVNPFRMTTEPHKHRVIPEDLAVFNGMAGGHNGRGWFQSGYPGDTCSGGGQNTGSASPYTENLGSGTALNIQPEYITLKLWKRLS